MTTPHPGTREYRNQVVRVADLTAVSDQISDVRFESCQIVGPAVLVLQNEITMAHCNFDVTNASMLFWRIPMERPYVVGAVAIERVEFYSCRFTNIGIALREDQYQELGPGFGFPLDQLRR